MRTPEQWAQLASYVHEDCTSELCPDLANLAMRFASAMAEAEAHGHERGIKEWRDIADKYTLKWDAELVRRVAAEKQLEDCANGHRSLLEQRARIQELTRALRAARTEIADGGPICLAQTDSNHPSPCDCGRAAFVATLDAVIGNAAPQATPIDMVLRCPNPTCGLQHVDAPEPGTDWTNPPHKSHQCHGCGIVWRPADVPTNGVAAIATRGKADTWPVPFPASVLCPKYEPHPWSIYADEYCVGSIYVDGRPRLCGQPRKDHKP